MMKTSKQIYRMPKICWSTLNAFRKKTSQFNPKRPALFCINHSGQNWVQVLDSNKVLPDRWKDIMLGEFLADNPVANCMDNDNNFGLRWFLVVNFCLMYGLSSWVKPHKWLRVLLQHWWLFPPKGWSSSEKPTTTS